jgi:acetyl-CoA carboxylase biotin carboxyl carrier protein
VRFGARRPPPPLDADLIRRLAELLAETGLSEIEYAEGDRRVRVVRPTAPAAAPQAPAAEPQPQSAPPPAGLAEHPGAVRSPMVGTAFLAPQPGAEPFVRLGETVAAGQPLLIIEAMKVMNQIRAPLPGRVAQILVEDAEPFEYGAVLMLIE